MLSIIVPTHNRAESLARCLSSIPVEGSNVDLEVVVVANNCSDHTKSVCDRFGSAEYVEEPRTAFSRARATGAANSSGDILVFLDDDTELQPESLQKIAEVFAGNPDCGLIAGQITPEYEIKPPAWTLEVQAELNGWSLFSPEMGSQDSASLLQVEWACGPLMAIRRNLYELVGGFPPDTIGVETNVGPLTFSKWYVGPGDYGLSNLVKRAGFSILYSPMISVAHHIPAYRMNEDFWISRFHGEGFYLAISDLMFWKKGLMVIIGKLILRTVRSLLRMIQEMADVNLERRQGLRTYQLRGIEDLSYSFAALQLLRHRNLGGLLWKMGAEGVADGDFEATLSAIPAQFVRGISPYKNESGSPQPVVRRTLQQLLRAAGLGK